MSTAIAQQKIRIRLKAFDRRMLDLSCDKIIETADKHCRDGNRPNPSSHQKEDLLRALLTPCGQRLTGTLRNSDPSAHHRYLQPVSKDHRCTDETRPPKWC